MGCQPTSPRAHSFFVRLNYLLHFPSA
uniref:Uncharacterized protein n=1 Tax=Anopheles quadriannulatus TaxID=34691 RepID=A0A182XU16_ANOQN